MYRDEVASRTTVRLAGANATPLGGFDIQESLGGGTRLQLRLAAKDGDGLKLGDPVEFCWEPESEPASRGALRLWISTLALVSDGGPLALEVEATDPLSWCSLEPQFRTYAGRVDLLKLAEEVLTTHPGTLPGWAFGAQSPRLAQEWLLQCHESGAAFLRRVAASAGCALFWDREALVGARVARPPGGSEVTRLRFAECLNRLCVERRPAHAVSQRMWTHPVTRETQTQSAAAPSRNGGPGGRGLSVRGDGPTPGSLPAADGSGVDVPVGDRIVVETTCAELRPGVQVEIPDGSRWVVHAVTHQGSDSDRYVNRAVAVPAGQWAAGLVRSGRSPCGPFQAEVTHTDDPQRLGRLRVRLCEDPERRPSPWIHYPTAAAGPERGWRWLPEVGERLLVVAPSSHPEALYVLGAIRGRGQELPGAWSAPDNSVKALETRNGVRIVLDDRSRSIRLETGEASLELDAQGHVRVKGCEFCVTASERIDLDGGQHVKMDAARIDLGI